MSSLRLPADQAARNDAINEIGKSVFLEAGAGAGKTRVMVDRIVQTVASGRVELRQIAAITFTEKAAGELRARVRQALAEAIENRGGSRGEDEIERLELAQGQVDAAHIETIHAFASSLLRDRPFEAGIDPYFQVLDQLGASLDLEAAWSEWLWEEQNPGAAAAIELALGLGLSLTDIREAADLLSKYRDLPPPQAGAEMPDPQEALEQWRFDAAEVAAAYAEAGTDKQREACANLVAGIEELAAAPPAQLAQRMLAFRPKKPSSGSRSAAARARWDAAAEARDRFATEVREGVLGRLLDALGAFVADHADRRRRAGRLNFDDLLLYARDLVRGHRDARAFFRRRYQVILIDEFQDTDPLQAELVLLLASGADTDDWRKAVPDAGRLFVVGDPKQSIYRFRRADISIYNAVRDMFLAAEAREPESAAVRQLTVNFRSRPDLIGWTNRVFRDVLRPDSEYPGVQADFQPTDPHRERSGTAVLTVDDPTEHQRVGEAREAEAGKLADVINALVAGAEIGGRAPLLLPDGHDDASRVPAHGDIAVLVRTRTEIDKYTRVLDRARIPYHLDSGRGFFARPEVRDLTNILMAVDDPTDEVAVLAALKSPLGSASDQELFDYVYSREPDLDGKRRPARFSLSGHSVPDEYDGPLRVGFKLLGRLRDGLRSRSLPQFIDFTLRESHLLDAQFAYGVHGEERAANLQMLVLRAAEFARAEGDSLRPFVQWLAQRREQDLSEAESSTSEVAGKVVRILTIHQAKGLEFPIVIVPKLGDGTADRTKVIVDRAAERLDIQIGSRDKGVQTPDFDRSREQAYNEAEARRQLYVASTRAKDWLILPRFFKNGKPNRGSFGDFLDEPLAAVPEELMRRTRPSDYDATAPEPRETTLPDWPSIRSAWQARRDEALERGTIDVVALAPSDHEDEQARDEEKVEREQAVQPDDQAAGGADVEPREGADGSADDGIRSFIPNAKARAAGMRRGSAIHRALSLADFADPDESIRRARRVAGEFPDLDPNDLLADFSNVLSSELTRRAAAADRYFLEMPLVSAQQTGDRTTIIEGIADLAFREAGGWVVVDFKSDRSRSDQLDAQYQRQVRDYARMLCDAGEPVSEAWLLYTRDGAPVRVALD